MEPYLKGLPDAIMKELARLEGLRPQDVSEMLGSNGVSDELFVSEDVGTSVYTAKIVDRVTISDDGDK